MPEIDHTVCLNCGKCVKICPAYNDTIQYDPVRVLAAASYDEEGYSGVHLGEYSMKLRDM